MLAYVQYIIFKVQNTITSTISFILESEVLLKDNTLAPIISNYFLDYSTSATIQIYHCFLLWNLPPNSLFFLWSTQGLSLDLLFLRQMSENFTSTIVTRMKTGILLIQKVCFVLIKQYSNIDKGCKEWLLTYSCIACKVLWLGVFRQHLAFRRVFSNLSRPGGLGNALFSDVVLTGAQHRQLPQWADGLWALVSANAPHFPLSFPPLSQIPPLRQRLRLWPLTVYSLIRPTISSLGREAPGRC